MTMRLPVNFPLLLMLALLAVPTLSFSQVSLDHYRDRHATAFFVHQDETDPCLHTFGILAVFDLISQQPPGPGLAELQVDIGVQKSNFCTGEDFIVGFGSVNPTMEEFVIEKDLSAAKMIATIEIEDSISGMPVSLYVAVNWEGIGELTRTNFSSFFWTTGLVSRFRNKGVRRDAQASGVISDGTLNFATDLSLFADIGAQRIDDTDVQH